AGAGDRAVAAGGDADAAVRGGDDVGVDREVVARVDRNAVLRPRHAVEVARLDLRADGDVTAVDGNAAEDTVAERVDRGARGRDHRQRRADAHCRAGEDVVVVVLGQRAQPDQRPRLAPGGE